MFNPYVALFQGVNYFPPIHEAHDISIGRAQEKPCRTLQRNRSTLSPRPLPPTSKRRGHPRRHPSDIVGPLPPHRSRRGPTRAQHRLESTLQMHRTGSRTPRRQRGSFARMTPATPTKDGDRQKYKLKTSSRPSAFSLAWCVRRAVCRIGDRTVGV